MRDRPEIFTIDYVRYKEYDGVDGITLSATVSRDRKLGSGVSVPLVHNVYVELERCNLDCIHTNIRTTK
jgi:hypothetical protein